MTKKRKISLAIVSFLLSAVFLLSGFMIWKEVSDRQKDKDNFDILAELVVQDTAEKEETKPTAEEESEEATEQESETETVYVRNLAPVLAENSECIGWVCIPDTAVNYPVMHTPNNPEKYLRKNFYKNYSQSGTPFLDGRCTADSVNLILYGHNMKNGTMFSAVTGYAKKDYAAAHSVIEYETTAGLDLYTVYAAVSVKKTDSWYGFIDCSDKESFDKAIKEISAKARYTTEAVPNYGDRLLTLSTCCGNSKDDRLIVIAVKQPPNQ